MREAARGLAVSILTYHITSNHVHVIAYAEDPEAIATLMQQAAGELARDYNRRKGCSGAFWEGRLPCQHGRWTQAIAVRERAFIEAFEDEIKSRRQMVVTEEGGGWILSEEHGAVFRAEK